MFEGVRSELQRTLRKLHFGDVKGFFVTIVRKTGHKDWNGLACLEELHVCVHSTIYYVSRN
jgi:hypothetical protein